MRIPIVQTRKIWYTLSGILVVLSFVAISLWGFRLGIDFTGGALMEVSYDGARPDIQEVRADIEGLDFIASAVVQPVEEQNVLLRLPFLSVDEHKTVVAHLEDLAPETPLSEIRYETIGPSISSELKSKSFWAIGIVVLAIVLYVAWAFRKVSRPVSSWKYGIAAIVALIHDVAIPAGVVAALGQIGGF